MLPLFIHTHVVLNLFDFVFSMEKNDKWIHLLKYLLCSTEINKCIQV